MTNNLILFNSILNEDYDTFVKTVYNHISLINIPNDNGETLLHYAAYYGLLEKFYALINFGCEIKLTHNGDSLLHYACQSGHDDFLVLELVKLGLNPAFKNKNGETSFHCVSNEKIAHYLNLWGKRNQINIPNLLDNDLNTIAHGCKINGNINGALYWIEQYPHITDHKNIYNQLWQDCKKRPINRCSY